MECDDIKKKGNVFVPVNKNKSRRDKNRMGGKPLFTILLFLYYEYRKHSNIMFINDHLALRLMKRVRIFE